MNCACGCGREVLKARARYFSARCRLKVSHERNSPVLSVADRKILRQAAKALQGTALAAEVERIARGGQLPLRLAVKPPVRLRGADMRPG